MYSISDFINDFPELEESQVRTLYERFTELVKKSVEEAVRQRKESFIEVLWKHLQNYGGKSFSQIYRRAGISKQTFSKIIKRRNEDYVPRKETVLKLIIGLQLNLEQAEELLLSAGYRFTDSIADTCVREAVQKKEWNLQKIDSQILLKGGNMLFSYN